MINLEARTVTAPPGTILLDAYASRSCPVKTQNAFNPTVAIDTPVDVAPVESNEALAELFDGGAQFEDAVLEQLVTSFKGRVVDLRPHEVGRVGVADAPHRAGRGHRRR